MIPNVGISDYGILDANYLDSNVPGPYENTGGGAAIFKKGSTNYCTMSVYPETGWLVFIQDGIRVIFNGTLYVMKGGTLDLRDLDDDPRNKTFYIYATIEDDKPTWLVSVTPMRKSGTMLKGATLVTNDKQILTLTRHQPFMIGEFVLSYTREGGIIPLSAGFPQDEGDFFFVHQGELLN